MFYWLFKKYLKRFTKEFEIRYQEEYETTHNDRLRTDWYWVQYLMFEEGRKK